MVDKQTGAGSEAPLAVDVKGGVATLTLNRPQAMNSFNAAMHEAMAAALARIGADEAVRALIITGAGRGFCAGQDLTERKRAPGDPPPDLGASLEARYNPMIRALVNFRVPTIAAVNGVAAGAGCSLALACDMVIAGRSAKFVQAFSKIGLIPDSGGTWMLQRLIGRAKALGMALTGEPVAAVEAERIGLIWKVVEDGELMAEANALAEGFASGAGLGLAKVKELMLAGATNDLDAQLDLERDTQRELGRSEDYAEGTRAFLEKRKPVYKGK
ncbi:MAG: 2-(1,2-epoxy-1,2-dihydrophenyl)acetyl-CoA isomerase [Rhodobiaceae bacterium]|nr:2-(1,2-epoxy-1,2-dihydrophenyl)acetyl-CoA isomerase [Rhodobiaceae bacterium]